MPSITLYSTPTCPFCKQTKDFFNAHTITYTNVDLMEHPERVGEVVEKSGQMGVPVTIINDGENEEVIVGFDEAKLSKLLHISSH